MLRVPDPQVAIGQQRGDHHSTSRPTATGLRLVDHPAAFDREGYYGDAAGDYADNAWRFGLFCRAALEALRADGRPLDVLHLHDWHTGPAAIYRDDRYADDPIIGETAILITLHNLAYHGWTPRDRLGQLGLTPGRRGRRAGRRRYRPAARRHRPRRARQHGLARLRGGGADARVRDGPRRRAAGQGRPVRRDPQRPRHDRLGSRPPMPTWRRRSRRRTAPARRPVAPICSTTLGFDPDDDGAVIGMIGRLDPQKGFDLLADASRRPARAAACGSSSRAAAIRQLADPFREMARRIRAEVAFIERFDRVMARRIYAGADFFAMPSRFEPCGQGQMIALRYGTPPIVHRVGGLADTVIDETTPPGRGHRVQLRRATVDGRLLAACRRGDRASGRQAGRPGRRCSIAAWRSTSTG